MALADSDSRLRAVEIDTATLQSRAYVWDRAVDRVAAVEEKQSAIWAEIGQIKVRISVVVFVASSIAGIVSSVVTALIIKSLLK